MMVVVCTAIRKILSELIPVSLTVPFLSGRCRSAVVESTSPMSSPACGSGLITSGYTTIPIINSATRFGNITYLNMTT